MLVVTLTGGSLWNPLLLGSAARRIKRSVLPLFFSPQFSALFSEICQILCLEIVASELAIQRSIEQSCRPQRHVILSRRQGGLRLRVSPLVVTCWIEEPKARRPVTLSKSYGFSNTTTTFQILSADHGDVISRMTIQTLPTRYRKLREYGTVRVGRAKLKPYRNTVTDTQSLRSSILNYKWENGRRYHAYQEGSYW